MDHFKGRPRFEIRSVMEQKPFENPAVQSFFSKWCEINDSIRPKIMDRKRWNSRGTQGILEKGADGKLTLFIPKDLQLWEMIGVMEVVDKDTFAAKPERASAAKEKILALGKTFENAGLYIARRLDGIKNGREIAEALALEFYQYGQSLIQGKAQEISDINELASHDLTSQETEAADQFLAGDTLYSARKQKLLKLTSVNQTRKDEVYERERQKTLAQFFRVAEKAFALEHKGSDGKMQESPTPLKPWQSNAPIHSAFLAKVEKAIAQKVETPKRELRMAIFRRGIEKLVGQMRETKDMYESRTGGKTPGWKVALNKFLTTVGFDPLFAQKKLVKLLDIANLKAQLERIRRGGDLEKISNKEREIADTIQRAVSSFPHQLKANNPAEMVASQYINCVGASTLGGALMKEAGLNYLVGDVPYHSILFLVTSDRQVEWRDMLSASFNERLTDEIIKGQRRDGRPLTVSDIVAFSQKASPEGLMFDVDGPKYREKLSWVKEGQRQYVTVFEPEYGQQIQVLYATGNALAKLGRHEEAVEAYRQAIGADPMYAYPYYGLGRALRTLGRSGEAVERYRQAIGVDPMYAYPYYGLGSAFRSIGRKKEAIEAYQKYIDLADKKSDDYWIKRAERIIAELKK